MGSKKKSKKEKSEKDSRKDRKERKSSKRRRDESSDSSGSSSSSDSGDREQRRKARSDKLVRRVWAAGMVRLVQAEHAAGRRSKALGDVRDWPMGAGGGLCCVDLQLVVASCGLVAGPPRPYTPRIRSDPRLHRVWRLTPRRRLVCENSPPPPASPSHPPRPSRQAAKVAAHLHRTSAAEDSQRFVWTKKIEKELEQGKSVKDISAAQTRASQLERMVGRRRGGGPWRG